MRVFIAGIDGYLGWALAVSLAARGHAVGGADLFLRRRWVKECGGESVSPIRPMSERMTAFQERFGEPLPFFEGDLRDYAFVEQAVTSFLPDAIVHLGEMPSASYSMIDVDHAVFTQTNNVVTTLNILFAMRDVCPGAHLVKMGTMGEYGTPNVDIPEGFFEIEYRGRADTLPFPRQAPSWYHWSKVHDSNNVMFACRTWDLASTDLMQGIVFGTRTAETGDDDRFLTRFDIDQCFGTVINRFCAQAVIGHPLTPFGSGQQRRGFIALRDAIQCLILTLENPARRGEYRVFNQFDEIYAIDELAIKVGEAAREIGLQTEICHVENPRIEKEQHHYHAEHGALTALGFVPSHDLRTELRVMLSDLIRWRPRIESLKGTFMPDIRWDGTRRKAAFVEAMPEENPQRSGR